MCFNAASALLPSVRDLLVMWVEELVMERIKLRSSTFPSAPDDLLGRSQRRRLSSEEMKHNFSVQPADDTPFGRPRNLLCSCVRCKWTFQVSPDNGTIVAFNNVGQPLEGVEAKKRIATFATGPCPAFADFPEYEEANEKARPHSLLERIHPLLHLFGLDRVA
jgi:hypothetical protein